MTSNPGPGPRILGSLRSAGGKGVVRIEDRYDPGRVDLWSALTDPGRLASRYGQVDRPGGARDCPWGMVSRCVRGQRRAGRPIAAGPGRLVAW